MVLDHLRDPRNGFWPANGAVFTRTRARNDKLDAQVLTGRRWSFSFLKQ